VFWVLFGLAAVALVTSIAIPILTIQPYSEQSPTMEKTIFPGDQIFAVHASGLRRGDVVVLKVPASGASDDFVKRVIGLPGDHVACCNAQGRVTVNGKPLDETYLYPGVRPSATAFSVTLRRGQLWVMGDDRSISLDSRQWGPVPVSGVEGRVILVVHGGSFMALRTPRTFVAEGLAPVDTRSDFYVRLGILAMASVALMLILTVFGITRFALRRRRWRRRPAGAPRPPRPLSPPRPVPSVPQARQESVAEAADPVATSADPVATTADPVATTADPMIAIADPVATDADPSVPTDTA
jgi:signal peptidase I